MAVIIERFYSSALPPRLPNIQKTQIRIWKEGLPLQHLSSSSNNTKSSDVVQGALKTCTHGQIQNFERGPSPSPSPPTIYLCENKSQSIATMRGIMGGGEEAMPTPLNLPLCIPLFKLGVISASVFKSSDLKF